MTEVENLHLLVTVDENGVITNSSGYPIGHLRDTVQVSDESVKDYNLIKCEAFVVLCSTGCTCCANEDMYYGPFRTEDDAIEAAIEHHSRRTLASQYADNGVYYIEKVQVQQIYEDRAIIGNSVVEIFKNEKGIFGNYYLGQENRLSLNGQRTGKSIR